jgi:hypothetical protein
LDRKKRFSVIALFSLGCFTCIASGIRISTIKAFYDSNDGTWTGSSIAIWSAMEINITIIAASIPPVKPLFSKYIWTPLFGGDVTEMVDTDKRPTGLSNLFDTLPEKEMRPPTPELAPWVSHRGDEESQYSPNEQDHLWGDVDLKGYRVGQAL